MGGVRTVDKYCATNTLVYRWIASRSVIYWLFIVQFDIHINQIGKVIVSFTIS